MITLSLAVGKDLGQRVSASTERSAEETEQKSFRYSLGGEISSRKIQTTVPILLARMASSSNPPPLPKKSTLPGTSFPEASKVPLPMGVVNSANSSGGLGIEAPGSSQNRAPLQNYTRKLNAAGYPQVSAKSIESRKASLPSDDATKKRTSAIKNSIRASVSKFKTNDIFPVGGFPSDFFPEHTIRSARITPLSASGHFEDEKQSSFGSITIQINRSQYASSVFQKSIAHQTQGVRASMDPKGVAVPSMPKASLIIAEKTSATRDNGSLDIPNTTAQSALPPSMSASSGTSMYDKKQSSTEMDIDRQSNQMALDDVRVGDTAHIHPINTAQPNPTSQTAQKAVFVTTAASEEADSAPSIELEKTAQNFKSEILQQQSLKDKTDVQMSVLAFPKTSFEMPSTSAKILTSPIVQVSTKSSVLAEDSIKEQLPSRVAGEATNETDSTSFIAPASPLAELNVLDKMSTLQSTESFYSTTLEAQISSISKLNKGPLPNFSSKDMNAKPTIDGKDQPLEKPADLVLMLANKSNVADFNSATFTHKQTEQLQTNTPVAVFQFGIENTEQKTMPSDLIAQGKSVGKNPVGRGVENAADSELGVHSESAEHILSGVPSAIEVGFSGSTQGWLRVRAEIAGDIVHASISSNSSTGVVALHQQVSALNLYLKNEHVPATVSILSHGPNGSFVSDDRARSQMENSSQQEEKRDAQSASPSRPEVERQKEESHPSQKSLAADMLHYQIGATHSISVLA